MKTINEYLLTKTKLNNKYAVTKGNELFYLKTKDSYAGFADLIHEFKEWLHKEIENSEMCSKNEFNEFKENKEQLYRIKDDRINEIVDKETRETIIDCIIEKKHTYKDVFEAYVKFYDLNKKNIKIV